MIGHKWRVKSVWVGVQKQIETNIKDYYDRELIGVIRRSGTVTACGHFCFVNVSYKGKKRTARGAEDRIYPFHSIVLEPGEEPKDLELKYLGWCNDHNTPAFLDKDGKIVEIVGAGKDSNNLKEIPKSLWKEEWR